MKHLMLVHNLKKLSQVKNIAGIQQVCSFIHPAGVADALTKFSPQHICEILPIIGPRTRAGIFSYLAHPLQKKLLNSLNTIH